MDDDYERRANRAAAVAMLAGKWFHCRCREYGLDEDKPEEALAQMAEIEAMEIAGILEIAA